MAGGCGPGGCVVGVDRQRVWVYNDSVEVYMTGRKYRAQILLDVEQHDALVEIARREGRSLSDLVREMLWQQLEQRGRAVRPEVRRRLEALERIRRHRAEVLARRGGKPLEVDSAEMIRRMREERDERSLLAGSRH